MRINQGRPDALTIARSFLKRGWKPVPVQYRKKMPIGGGWQTQEITRANVGQHFNGHRINIGVQLGHASGGLTDVDLDCEEALHLAEELLPPTNAIFGRRSRARSHWLYVTDLCDTEETAAIRYDVPRELTGELEEDTLLVEIRIGAADRGAQTVAPGSIHPSGEPVRWDDDGEPAKVAAPCSKNL
jgi:Bifunctional DNA primase/polymerase, N-terminal